MSAEDRIERARLLYERAVFGGDADALATAPFADGSLFGQGVDETTVTVQLNSTDFDIPDPIRPLRVPRAGKSSNKARFDLSPLHDGASSLTATLHKDGNFLQRIAIDFVVGGTKPVPVETSALGRPASAASVLRPRDVSLQMSLRDGGYECVAVSAVAARAHLPLQPAQAELAIVVTQEHQPLFRALHELRSAGGDAVFECIIARRLIPCSQRQSPLFMTD